MLLRLGRVAALLCASERQHALQLVSPDLVKCLRCRTAVIPLDGHRIEKGEMTPATSLQSTTSSCLSHQD